MNGSNDGPAHPAAPALDRHHHVAERFWEKVEIQSNGCWEWQAATKESGYGVFRLNGTKSAHRIAYRLTHGRIPEGKLVRHTCDNPNPSCVNPSHLEVGTPSDNQHDRDDRLSIEDNIEIQHEYETSDKTQMDLAEEYGVCQGRISEIIREDYSDRKTRI